MDEIEIPEVITEDIDLIPKSKQSTVSFPMTIMGILLCLGIGGLLSMFLLSSKPKSAPLAVKQPITKSVAPKQSTSISKNPPAVQAPPVKSPAKISSPDLLGHLPYDLAPQSTLEAITADGSLKMRSAAARKFKQMQADARAAGVILTAISAFRTTETQEQLFFGIKEQRVQNAAKRAKVSAPPGYSEHHTGYAVDLGDGNAPATNLETTFADTAAFAWLEKNALRYSFELSFPPNNKQGVSYEPWHWRFVGDRDSLETFYKVKN